MKMKKKSLITKIIILVIILQFIIIPTISQSVTWSEITEQAKDFLDLGYEGSDIDFESVKTSSDTMYNLLATIGVAATVIIGGILGIQFMLASAEDKAKIKEALIPYVLGCVVIFGAFAIWRIIVNAVQSIA